MLGRELVGGFALAEGHSYMSAHRGQAADRLECVTNTEHLTQHAGLRDIGGYRRMHH